MNRQSLGIALTIGPLITWLLAIAAYALAGVVFANLPGTSNTVLTLESIIRLSLGLIGMIAMISIPIGVIVGIFLLSSSGPDEPTEPQLQQ